MEEETRGKYKMTSDTLKKLEEAFALGTTVKDACIHAKISRDSYYRWLRNEPGLSDRFELSQLGPVLKAKKTIIDNLDDPRIAAWYLERKRRNEYGKGEEPFEYEVREEPPIDIKDFLRRPKTLLRPGFVEDENGQVVRVAEQSNES